MGVWRNRSCCQLFWLIAIVLFSEILSKSEIQDTDFEDCSTANLLKTYSIDEKSTLAPYQTFQWTNRTLSDFFKLFPDFIRPLFMNRSSTEYLAPLNILEIGCGDGHALGDFQYMFPLAKVVGVNKGYGYMQVENERQWVIKRIQAGYKIRCRKSTNTPSVPRIVIMSKGVGSEPIPFGRGKFDLVFSMFSLDSG
jgi:SAM-dependent methyltransferase